MFPEDTPVPLLERIEPDVLIKGGSYAIHEVVGREIIEAYGGTVAIAKFVDGVSTTSLLDKIALARSFIVCHLTNRTLRKLRSSQEDTVMS